MWEFMISTFRGISIGGVAGLATGTAAGAAIGSVVPGAGTVLGGFVGACIGVVVGSVGGGVIGAVSSNASIEVKRGESGSIDIVFKDALDVADQTLDATEGRTTEGEGR